MSSMELEFDLTPLLKGLKELDDKTQTALLMVTEAGAAKMEKYAKANRPWTDRTSRARNGLQGLGQKVSDGFLISLSHSVDYGIHLEMRSNKKYAILMPTINKIGPEVIEGFKTVLS